MNRVQVPLIAAMLSAAVISLVGCGGGGGSSVVASEQPAVNNVTVSPSLGKFSAGAHVTIKNAAGTSVGTANTTDAGTATVNIGSHTGSVVIEVTGDTNVTYYDEGSKRSQPFGTSAVLRAIAPTVSTVVGVTAATNASVESIKSSNGGAIPPTISADAIKTSNNKIAVALGITDVLQAPKLVDATTGNTLDAANVADLYAVKLAALAKLASTGKTALDVAVDIAKDLQDGLLDGKFTPVSGPVVPNTSTTYDVTTVAADIAANATAAVADLGNNNMVAVVKGNPTLLGNVTTNVTQVTSAVTPPDVVLAKNLFSELRTTLSSFANNSKTGFLNNQAARIDADLKAAVAPASNKVFNRLDVVGAALKLYEVAQSGVANNSVSLGTTTIPGEVVTTASWFSRNGQPSDAWAGISAFHYCYSLLPITPLSPVTCLTAGIDSAGPGTTGTVSNNGTVISSTGTIKLLRIVLTPTGTTNQFSYVATREDRTIDLLSKTITGVAVPVTTACGTSGCTGNVTKTLSNGLLTGFDLGGTMPPSGIPTTGGIGSGVDSLTLSATKAALTTAKNFRYALSGTVSTTSNATPTKPVSFSFDNGSYIDVDETNAGNATGTQLVAFNLVGTAKTDATKVAGTLTMSGFTKDKSGTNTIASSVVINGVLSDTSPGGAGDMLSGKLEATITGYDTYDITKPTAGSNYIQGTAKFTGTIQAPSRPLMKLVISGTDTGPHAGSATVNYTYGTISITASGTSSSAGSTVTMTNQDGIQIASDPSVANQQLITKAGVTLATVTKNGVINYVDGSSETLN